MPHFFSENKFQAITFFLMNGLCAILFFLLIQNTPTPTKAIDVAKSHSKKSLGTIVIDPGHGGKDPGKIGINGVYEKDVNLAIALKLKPLLENKGFTVHLTRTKDELLANPHSKSQKKEDMRNRLQFIKEKKPLITIGIHQNSYPDKTVRGPQVFYYASSSEGKELASHLQKSLNTILKPKKNRNIQGNNSYYFLKKTPTSTTIVECGFLSNPSEAALLCDELYQSRVARAIYFGILSFYESFDTN